jgi:TRAP-type uncharacterized transport system substrate-binding protein
MKKYNAHTQLESIKQYFSLFFDRERKGWVKVIFFYNLYIPFILVVITGIAIYINPLPPKTAYLAIGQDGSSYQDIANSYKSYFKKNNIDLELIPTNGLTKGLQGLHANNSKINASFVTVGTANDEQYPGLVSLGSVQYVPIWIFYKGPEIKTDEPFQYLLNKKVSIGLPESATNIMFRKLSSVSYKSGQNINKVLELSHKEGAASLRKGEIDALFIVDSMESNTVEELIKDPTIKIMNFSLADAYMKKLTFLQKLNIPKGSRNIENIDPPHDITILASTTNLLIEKDTHRAIQWAFLLAAKDSNRHADTFFSAPNYFPRDIDQSFPLSPIAEHFYKNGASTVFNYVPFWIASLLDGIWLYILGFITLVYPSIKLIESARLYPSKGLLNNFFMNARVLDEALLKAKTKDEIEEILKILESHEQSLNDIYLYGDNSRFYFNQKNAINSLKITANQQLEKIQGDQKVTAS